MAENQNFNPEIIEAKYNRIYTKVSSVFNNRPMRFILRDLGYHDVPIERKYDCTKHMADTYNGLSRTSICYLIFEFVYAMLSIAAMSIKFIGPNDVAFDFQLVFWGLIGTLRFLIIISKSLFQYNSSKKPYKISGGDYSMVGNAVQRKRYKPYLICLVLAVVLFCFLGIISRSDMVIQKTHNVWLSPLVICFSVFFCLTAILNSIDILCYWGGYRPAVFNIDLKDQLKEMFQ